MKLDGSGTMKGTRSSGSYAPFLHWSTCPQASLGPSGPSFIVEASSEALTQARFHLARHLGPERPSLSHAREQQRVSATGRSGRLGGGICIPEPSEPPKVFQARDSEVFGEPLHCVLDRDSLPPSSCARRCRSVRANFAACGLGAVERSAPSTGHCKPPCRPTDTARPSRAPVHAAIGNRVPCCTAFRRSRDYVGFGTR